MELIQEYKGNFSKLKANSIILGTTSIPNRRILTLKTLRINAWLWLRKSIKLFFDALIDK